VQQWIALNLQHARIEYLPPYSPELNPIEEFFALEKEEYRTVNRPVARERNVMRARVQTVYEILQGRDLHGYFHHMREFLAIAHAGQIFP
jgi:hypothetical protein